MTIVDPLAAPSRSRPRMLLPSSSRAPRATRTVAACCDASRTNLAAARACRPRRFTIVTSRVTIRLRPGVGPHQVGRDTDGFARVLADLARDAEQSGIAAIEAGELDEHREIDAGDHFHLIVLEE